MSICFSITTQKKKKQLHLHTKQIVLIKIITHNIIVVRIGETIQIDAKEYKKNKHRNFDLSPMHQNKDI